MRSLRRFTGYTILALVLVAVLCASACALPEPPLTGSGEDLVLTEGGVARFTLVYAVPAAPSLKAEIRSLADALAEAGITVEQVDGRDPGKIQECEILIGDGFVGREECAVDLRSLGDEGYTVRRVGQRLAVIGGSTAATVTALGYLRSQVLRLGDEGTDAMNMRITGDLDHTVRESYALDRITVGGVSLEGRSVAHDGSEESRAAADLLREAIWDRCGEWMSTTGLEGALGNREVGIVLRILEDAGADGFRIRVEGEQLIVECAYPMLIGEGVSAFIDGHLPEGISTDPAFDSGLSFTHHVATLTYADFGAVGDGLVDDFDAIKRAHERANLTGQTVVAQSGCSYNMGAHGESIEIATDTVWEGATFIIDDSEVGINTPVSKTNIFTVVPTGESPFIYSLKPLSAGQTNIGITLPESMLLLISNENVRQYIRYGSNANDGTAQQEIILVHPDGSVDPSTPIMWDYGEVTSVECYTVTDRPITISGGCFITVANTAPSRSVYYARGIAIKRSGTTVRGLSHLITGEGDSGAPYTGFLSISRCHGVMLEEVTVTGHRTYIREGSSTSMGSYELRADYANAVTWRNVTQTNSINDTTYWGVMGSNFSKNLTYDGCTLSRFDAHQGVYNATIKNSELGHQKISIIGMGTLLIEGVTVHGNQLVKLRNDYGSTWQGDLVIRNVRMINTGNVTLVDGSWNNHYFGYTCHLPTCITVEGLTLDTDATVYVVGSFRTGMDSDTFGSTPNKNPVVLTQLIRISGTPYTVEASKNASLLPDVDMEVSD